MMASADQPTAAKSDVLVIVAAHNEAERIAATIAALAEAFPGAPVWVADDGSSDATAAICEAAGASVVRSELVVGKGGAMTLAARVALASVGGGALSGLGGLGESGPLAVLCDGDLGESAARLGGLAGAVDGGQAELAVAVFARRAGGGLGLAVGFARWAIRRRCGLDCKAPISGQRAMRAGVLERALPFASGYGMEMGMTIDVVRAGARVREVELDLSHRATGRTPGGFLHRGRQLADFVRVYISRR
jgi:glycosyltransferase involved in cell wall biosynthesis